MDEDGVVVRLRAREGARLFSYRTKWQSKNSRTYVEKSEAQEGTRFSGPIVRFTMQNVKLCQTPMVR